MFTYEAMKNEGSNDTMCFGMMVAAYFSIYFIFMNLQ
jgi:hypothetical protein